MIIGSHVSMSGKDMLLGSVKEALSYGSNTFMFYTGAPQNTRRKAISELKVEEAKALMKENNIDLKNVVVHAPYIINLANTVKEETFELAVNFLKQELQRCQDIGTSILVLHPGSHVKAGEEVGLQQIIKGLNEVLKDFRDIADSGRAILMITHDIMAALKIADKVAIFYAGSTLEIANTSDFKQKEVELRHP